MGLILGWFFGLIFENFYLNKISIDKWIFQTKHAILFKKAHFRVCKVSKIFNISTLSDPVIYAGVFG